MGAFVLGLVIVLVVLLISCVRIVPQAKEYVIEFLGKYRTTWSAGLHFKIPLLERVAKKITLKEQLRFPLQNLKPLKCLR